ncbi:hypothetical protein [uncultured Methanobrevibacter sp.]|uniref:hypothetical protein n=1 Tax=uncultured Methanobrevibacter sp. TaxID=253161 RepID=UPI00320A1AC2
MSYDKAKYVKRQEATKKEIKQILDEFIPTLVVSPEEIEKYLAPVSGFYQYSLLNQICATYEFYAKYGKMPEGIWATYLQFKRKHNKIPKRGASGVHMIRPQRFSYEVVDEDTGETEVKEGLTFKPFVVFDNSQTISLNKEKDDKITGQSSISEEEIDKIIEKHWKLIVTDYEFQRGATDGKSFIELSYHENTTINSRISTRLHEIAHILLKHSERDIPRAVAELESESVSFMCTTLLGLKNEKSRLYIANWNGLDARDAVRERSQLLIKTAEEIVKLLGIDA